VLALCGVSAAVFLQPSTQAQAAEGVAPVIGHVTATEVAEHEEKVEAQVNPGGLETDYEVRLVWQLPDPPGGPPPNAGEGPTGGAQTQTGRIVASSGDQTVSATLTGLQWGYVYYYVIIAANSVAQTKGESPYQFGFHISGEFPNGEGSGPPFESEIPIWYNKLSEEESAQTIKEYEAKQRQIAKEHEEQQAREQARIAEEAHVPMCAVPSLRGDTVSRARRVLEKAHCRLGRVIRRSHRRGVLHVVEQNPGSGSWLAAGTSIAIVCRPERHIPRHR
jgi:hypothetical protein